MGPDLPRGPGPLAPEQLCRRCDPAGLGFSDTSELPEPDAPFGQDRAMQALRAGVKLRGPGFNIFVLGNSGSGRHHAVRSLLEDHVARLPPPQDCCYLYNFREPQKPRILLLPPGEGGRLRAAMERFVAELRRSIESALESEEYRSRLEAIRKDYKQREEGQLQALAVSAGAQGVALVRSSEGLSLTPLRDGEPLSTEAFEALPQAERERLQEAMRSLGDRLEALLHELPQTRREMHRKMQDASRATVALAAGLLIDELEAAFALHPPVLAWLHAVREDILDAGGQFRTETTEVEGEEVSEVSGTLSVSRYQVNLLVGHGADSHAPIVTCDNPTYPNLVGRIDQVAHLGTLLTNFTLIKAGALQRANGGFLLLDAVQVLEHAYSWDGLKRALKAREVRIESLPEALGLGSAGMTLEPEPVPLSAKVILIGERIHYYLLQALDPEFDELFRIAADFEDDVPRDPVHEQAFARLVGSMARFHRLRACDAGAVARLVEQAARIAGEAGRLSTQTRWLDELLHEADATAAEATRSVIGRTDVLAAIAVREQRVDRVRDRWQHDVLKDRLRVVTGGMQTGQVNGLAVVELGGFRFGHPLRVTATARFGEDRVMDIERESSLGQPVHSKGVLILSSYLAARYAAHAPLSFAASLVLEQSYGPVEGDSASLAELCALLSAIGRFPLLQGLAVTGSVDQFGHVQAVGAVNEKVEGFFDLCRARGLSGEQGVLVPASNLGDLMLREEVVQAAQEGRFHIHAVDDADEAVAMLSGLPSGDPDAAGLWPAGSFNHAVAARLEQLAVVRQTYGTGQRPRMRKPRKPMPFVVSRVDSRR